MLPWRSRVIHHFFAADLHASDKDASTSSCSDCPGAPPGDGCGHAGGNDGVGYVLPPEPRHGRGAARPADGRIRFGGGGALAGGQQSLEVKAGVALPGRLGRQRGLGGL